jgi:WD40-like Beta Propeller Repeat
MPAARPAFRSRPRVAHHRAAHHRAAYYRAARMLPVAVALALLSACSGGSSPAQPGGQASTSGAASASASPTTTQASGGPASPGIVAVTTKGALVVLRPRTGAIARTLVPSGVTGDEISVAGNGTVYFATQHGCTSSVESVADTGGTPATIADGSLPAVSPDGSKLAYARQPSLTQGCVPGTPDLTKLYKLVVRTLSSGDEASYPMVPRGQDTGLPAPISHLSWAADNDHLAVSIAAIQDNEGWNLALVDTAAAKYYLSGGGISFVPATGKPSPKRSYLREGVFLPDGSLFVSRACCAGVPVHNTSRLMWEVTTAGTLLHQVAIGFASLEHTSLDASANGQWLLYLAGHDLYVSDGGATPRKLASGLIAAAWK